MALYKSIYNTIYNAISRVTVYVHGAVVKSPSRDRPSVRGLVGELAVIRRCLKDLDNITIYTRTPCPRARDYIT